MGTNITNVYKEVQFVKFKIGIDDWLEAEYRAHELSISKTCWFLNMLERWNDIPLTEDVYEDDDVEERDWMWISVPISKRLSAAIKQNFEGYSLKEVFSYCLAKEFGAPCGETMEFLDELLEADPWYFD